MRIRVREGIEQSGVSIERLTSELERPSAYSESLRSLNRRLDEVSAELLGAVKSEDVIADSNAVERDDAEPDKGTADLRQVEGIKKSLHTLNPGMNMTQRLWPRLNVMRESSLSNTGRGSNPEKLTCLWQ